MIKYSNINAKVFQEWKKRYNFDWMKPINHNTFIKAQSGIPLLTVTPLKVVPFSWYADCAGKKVLGIAAGGGQQMPIFAALGAECTLLDISDIQLQSDKKVSEREGYSISLLKWDMSESLPFHNDTFDYVINPISNHYIENPISLFQEIFRVLKPGGFFIAGLDNGFYWPVNPKNNKLEIKLPINPLKDEVMFQQLVANKQAIQFSHTIEEQIGGQLKSGFILLDLYEDTEEGIFQELNIPTFIATLSQKASI